MICRHAGEVRSKQEEYASVVDSGTARKTTGTSCNPRGNALCLQRGSVAAAKSTSEVSGTVAVLDITRQASRSQGRVCAACDLQQMMNVK
mmetsp:Transcript_9198/g.16336  ORF Transcript_9198/g.16336 Transcript_9198/m.16336 type:complete len:90 (-) Transcript_9198:110-379(-)